MASGVFGNLPVKLLSLVVAIVLWFAILGSRNIEITKEVGIEIITPLDLAIASDVPDKVSFRLSGPKAFLRNILDRKEDPIRVNFSTSKAGLMTYRFYQDNISLPLGVKVVSISPVSINVKLEEIKRKEVPLKLSVHGASPAGYKILKLDLDKKSIRIKGPASKLDLISEVYTMPVNLSKLTENSEKSFDVDLEKWPGVSVDGELPRIKYEVEHITSTFRIKNSEVKVITKRKFKIEPKEVSFHIKANPDDLRTLDRSRIVASADMKNLGPGTYDVVVKVDLPSNMKLIKVVPSRVKVTLY